MAYQAPSVSAAGLTIPSYTDILDDLIAQYKTIYGQDVYLGTDSADYQFLSVIALRMSDVMQSLQLAYNNRSPLTAISAALDTLVKLNGIARKSASYSSVVVTLTGTPNTVISQGVVGDVNGNTWSLPDSVSIPFSGSIDVTAICQTLGAITALPGDVTKIVTPTAGWLSVTNAAAAAVGQPVETDSQLRARQAVSTALPSQTMLAGTIAAIASLANVTRYNILENPTGAVDANGTPPHSITCVVEGGSDIDVATAIFNNRGIGCYTNGTTSVDVTDSVTGVTMTMRFSRPTYVPIYVAMDVHQLAGFTSATQDAIKSALANYLNSLQIGESLTISGLYAAALSAMSDITRPTFSIRACKADVTPAPAVSNDIAIAYDHVTEGLLANITVNLV